MTAETRAVLPHHLNLQYGPHLKQRLDLYLPQGVVRDAPVLVFFHGGGFMEGHRAHYGGDRSSIFLSGHSAGALLVAEAGADRTWMAAAGLPASVLRGMVPVSGRYDLTAAPSSDQIAFAPSPDSRDEASPLKHIHDPVQAAVVAQGQGQEYERNYTKYSPDFVRELKKKGVDAQLIVLPTATHIDMVFALAEEWSPLFQSMAAMIEKYAA